MTATEDMIHRMTAKFPQLEQVYDDHVENEGVLLPHLFLWDVVAELVETFSRHDSDGLDWQGVLAFFGDEFDSGDKEIVTLISTSFLPQLPHPHQAGHELIRYLGPSLATRFSEIRPSG